MRDDFEDRDWVPLQPTAGDRPEAAPSDQASPGGAGSSGFCTECGAHLPPEVKFCGQCGTAAAVVRADARTPAPARAPYKPPRRRWFVLGGVALAIVFAAAAIAGPPEDAGSTRRAANTSTQSSASESTPTALEMMASVFVGNYSQSEIQAQVDLALRLYGEPISNETRSRAGSALVTLRQDLGVPEMDILDHMIRSHVPGVEIPFGEAVGLSATFIAAGDR